MTVGETAVVTATGDSSLLLGRAGCPVWLNPERFLAPDFNADACVADLRRYVPLATLQNELSSYLATLKTKLVEVINEDYADYVGLSGRLANVEGSVVRMRKPLLDLRDKLHAVQEAVRSELNSLNQGLRKRKEVATQRALLELILEVSHVAAKVDKLLEELAASDRSGSTTPAAAANGAAPGGPASADGSGAGSGTSDAELLAQCRMLERVAAEVSRLAFLANKGKDLAFVRSLEPRIAAHRAALRSRLATALALALAPAPPGEGSAAPSGPRSIAAALHALHAAADLGEAATADAAVRSVVVAPLVERLVGEHKGHSSVSLSVASAGAVPGSAGGGGGLPALLGSILSAIRAQLGPLLDASLVPGSALRSIDLLSNAVLDEVQGTLAAAMPGVFSPGVPPAFHANYLATLAWLRQLEGMCATRGSVERLRSSAAYASLMRRWNTSVYFSLLYQEVAGELEDALSTDKLELAALAGTNSVGGTGPITTAAPPQLAATAALLRCLRRAVSPDVVLPPLTDRFLRLVLQLAQRYATWVAAAATARREGPAPAAAGAGTAGSGVAPVTPTAAPLAQGVGSGATGSPGGASPSGPAAWAPMLPADEVFAVVADTETVNQALLGSVTAAFLELLPPAPPSSQQAAAGSLEAAQGKPPAGANSDGATSAAETAASSSDAVAAAVRGALAEVAAAVQSSGRSLAAAVTDEVVERCASAVRQLKGITATYRVTSKAPPVRASHYVSGVLTPLRQLLEAGPVKRLAPELQQELVVVPVAEGVCSRYAALADELLVSVRKTESSLKRLKKAKGGAGGEEDSAAGLSDSDKITLQLHLDVEELGVQLNQLLLPPGSDPAALLPAFRRLKEVVAPPPGLPQPLGGGGLLSFVRQASRARTQLFALTAASAGLIACGMTDGRPDNETMSRLKLPDVIPAARADAKIEAQQTGSKLPATVSIALTGFEDVQDVNGFVTSALQKTLKHQKNSPLQSMVSSRTDTDSSNLSPLSFGQQAPAPTLEPAAFYSQLEKQPLSEKILILDDIIDSVIMEAQRSAEVSGLTVGMLGGGLACYALVGWWADLALPGVGTVACSAVAGTAGHHRAQVAAKRTRTRLLNAVLDSQPVGLRNAFIDYLSAPSLDVKQRIASEVRPAVFFRDFYTAVQPLLKQVLVSVGGSQELVLRTAA
ncbi:component of oligomeric golgi complex 2 [Volvox carteri f. nagariensis]|uniref:Conserved oligomeric Golgi complex subunit 2 n=1 Tax=Volvox carteri f. nagariensis TaxID=3068 RepID=D8TL51_VOLCA|nr:component of oligomeric golgi complex 2 [Volvox carteri f. nagariensis]EFJ51678.1 component of oligomeric golgi complex 2 [Volvox carteri f. nagariensis]|eukprot:XP_002947088.1 component of oligomeric golgi complex 2 [Volvox carteri f. nagariensis]